MPDPAMKQTKHLWTGDHVHDGGRVLRVSSVDLLPDAWGMLTVTLRDPADPEALPLRERAVQERAWVMADKPGAADV